MQHVNRNQPDKPPSQKRRKREEPSNLWHFESMDRFNRAMQGTNDLEQVMKDVLDTLLSVFECDRAWLVYPCDPDSLTWQVPMERTRPEYPSVLPIGVELPLDPVGAEIYRILRSTDGPVKFGPGEEHLVPVEIAVAFKVQSFIAMAFYPKIGKPWSFGLHQCSYARIWTPEEARLFQEIGRRLSDTLSSLLAYRDLQESEKQIKHLIDTSPLAMVILSGSEERIETVNDKFIELFGYTIEDIPDVADWWPLAYPDEKYREEIKTEWYTRVEQAIRTKGQIEPMEATVRCKDGSNRYVEFRFSSIGQKHLVTFVDLTERKRAEEALSASEAELRTLINTMTDIIFVGNSEGRFLKIVDTSSSLLYKPSKELLGRTLHEVFPKDQADFFLNHLRQALKTQQPVNFEYSLPIGGQEMWFYAAVSPMTDDKTLMVARDITDLKKAEAQLLASEQLFRALVENSPDFIARYDREFRRIYVNPAIQKLFGVPAENVLGKTPSEQSPVYAPQVYIDHLRYVIETSAETAAEMPYRTANGEVHWGHMRFVPEFGPDGQVASVLAIGRDIQEIKENERRFRMLAENFPDLVMRFDRDGRHIYVNPAFEKTFGMSVEAVIGKTLQELSQPSNSEENRAILTWIRRAFNEGMASETEVRWETTRGERIFENRYVPEKDAAGNVITVLCIARDLTEQKQAEDELRQNREVALQFTKQLAALQNVTNELSKVESVDELCLRAVQLGRSRLGFDRVSIWFIEEHLGIMRGSFGTDERGELRDERNAQVEFRHEGLAWLLFSHGDQMALVEHRPLYNHLAQEVGVGDNAMAALWDGGKVIGVISVDNLSTGQPIREHQLEGLRLYATTLGHLITRKRAESALRESEEKYRLLHENAGVGIGYYKPNGEIISYNQLAANHMKGKPEDFKGKSIYEVFPSEEAEFYMERIQKSLESESTLEYADHLVLPSGEKWLLSIFTRICDTQQNVIGVQIISQDITEQKQAEEALRASENRFRVLSETAFVGIYIIQDGRLSYVNSTLAKIFGYTPEELTGADPRLVIHPDDHAMVLENIRRRIDGEIETIHYEFRGRCKDGGTKNIEVLGGRVDFGGKTAIIGNLMDITERKRHELEREAIISVSTALRKATRRVEILTVILDQLVELFGADGSLIAMPNAETRDILIEMGRGVVGKRFTGLSIPRGTGISGWMIANKKPYLNNHADADPLFYRPDLLGGSHCVAAVPLIAQEQAIGALWIVRHSDIKEQELRLLNAIADIAANAIHRVMLHEQTVQQLHHLIALHQIDLAISANFDLSVTLKVILKNVKDELEVDAASILLIDTITHTLDYAAGIGFRTRHIEHSHVKLGHGYAGRAAQEYCTISGPDLNREPEMFSRSSLLADEEFLSHYATPLVVKGQVKGVLEIFHRKTFDPDQEWISYFETLATQAAIAIESASLFENLQRSNMELMLAYDATIEGWSRALDLRDRETEGHTQRVTEMVLELAEKIGMSDAEKMNMKRGALLHDIGKMGVPDSILLKPGPLSESDWEVMRQHPLYAFQMLSPIQYLKHALEIPYCHHEKWDGTGYPRALQGEEIPLSARLFSVVDVFDALTSDRPYRAAWPREVVYRYLEEQAGKAFDPRIVKVFLDIMKQSTV